MSACRRNTFITLETLLHVALVTAAFFISGLLHNSDSLMTQVPAETDATNNITKVDFGIKKFSIGNNEDIEFSDEQKDVLGGSWSSSHTSFHILQAFMIAGLVIPVIIAIKRRCCCRMDTRLVISKLLKNFAMYSIPLIAILTILMAVPFVLLTRSNLCGPNYIELRFEQELEYSSDDDDDYYHDDDCIELQGTVAIVHNDVNATCSVAPTGIAAAVLLALWPFAMVGQAFLLNWRGNKLESAFRNEAATNATVIEVYEEEEQQDKSKIPQEDDTVQEDDVEKAQIY